MKIERELPRYKSHKTVYALQIDSVSTRESGEGVLSFVDRNYGNITVSAAYMEKHSPVAGGFYVVYQDGYQSFSPAHAFENGYHLVEKTQSEVGQTEDGPINSPFRNPQLTERIRNDFRSHALDKKGIERVDAVRISCEELGHFINAVCPDGREKHSALSHLEMVMFFANAGIARNPKTSGEIPLENAQKDNP
jgi:hypothetical protein